MKKILFTVLFSFGFFITSVNASSSPKNENEKPFSIKKGNEQNKKRPSFYSYTIVVHCANGHGGTLCCYDTYAEALADVPFAIQWYCSPPFNV